MKIILLDENLPVPLKNDFSENFEVLTVYDKGWQSKQNGELLQAIEDEGIDFLMTADRNLEYQQNLDQYNLRLIVLITYDNRYKTLKDKVPIIEEVLLSEESTERKVIKIDLRPLWCILKRRHSPLQPIYKKLLFRCPGLEK
jgi:predicted nuclease of predicted toxin-antitoxin system